MDDAWEYNFIEPGVYAEDFNGISMSLIIIPILTATDMEKCTVRYLGEDGLDIIKSRNTRFATAKAVVDFGVIYAWTDLEDVKTERVAMGVGSIMNQPTI